MSRTEHHPSSRPDAGPTWLRAGAAAAVAAVAGNLAVLVAARVGDASLVVVDNGDAHEVAAAGVVVATLVPLVVGTLVVAVVALHWLGVIRVAQVVGGAFALLSVGGPLTIDTDGGTSVALAAMHVLAGAAFVAGLEMARRRLDGPRPDVAADGSGPAGRTPIAA